MKKVVYGAFAVVGGLAVLLLAVFLAYDIAVGRLINIPLDLIFGAVAVYATRFFARLARASARRI